MTTAVEFIEPMGDADGAARAAALFEARFGTAPAGVWAAPGRVNLIGEHTDYNGGLCLPIALPHRTYVALAPRDDTTVRVISDMTPDEMTMVDLDGLAAGGVDGWGAYPIGVAWALREAGFDQVRGFDAVFSSCVPLGSGLSSSAAMTCSTALALDDVYGLGFGGSDEGRITLIDAAVMAENEMAGASTGGLDQNASMRCAADHAIRLDCMPGLTAAQSVRQEPFDLSAYGLELLVLDTQAPHQLNDGQYQARRTMCEEAAQILGVPNLRVVADQVNAAVDPAAALEDVLVQLDDETMRRRVRHVITEIGRVDDFIGAFGRGDIETAGALFNASHDSLRDDYEVTVPELDVAVDVARNEGAYGARMTGGGFGGSIIALVNAGAARIAGARLAVGAPRERLTRIHARRPCGGVPRAAAVRYA